MKNCLRLEITDIERDSKGHPVSARVVTTFEDGDVHDDTLYVGPPELNSGYCAMATNDHTCRYTEYPWPLFASYLGDVLRVLGKTRHESAAELAVDRRTPYQVWAEWAKAGFPDEFTLD
jgi:hypothetical protein